jgi:hypothetical protein
MQRRNRLGGKEGPSRGPVLRELTGPLLVALSLRASGPARQHEHDIECREVGPSSVMGFINAA